MLKPLYHQNFSSVGSGGRISYEKSHFVPTKDGFKEVTVVLSDFQDKKSCVPYTNFNASVLITAGKELNQIPSAVMGIDVDDVERIQYESSASNSQDVE